MTQVEYSAVEKSQAIQRPALNTCYSHNKVLIVNSSLGKLTISKWRKMFSTVDYCSTNISEVEATDFKILHYFLLSVKLFLERWGGLFLFFCFFRINIGHPNS